LLIYILEGQTEVNQALHVRYRLNIDRNGSESIVAFPRPTGHH
jgi:hypothetical protein